jgi:hypothetical protein
MDLKLLLVYNIKPNFESEYYRYVLSEFLPALQNAGLYMVEGWHTAYGDYPVRMIGFQSNSGGDVRQILQGIEWKEAKIKLLEYVQDYEERIVTTKNMFQFFIPKPG